MKPGMRNLVDGWSCHLTPKGGKEEGKGLASEQTEGNGSGFSLGWHFVNPENW